MKAVIMVGGKGTRIASVDSTVPKPMIRILDKPILQYQIECLRAQGIKEIVLVCGHLKDVIINYFGNGQKFGVSIEYIIEDTALGTAGALGYLKSMTDDMFLLLNGDIIFDVDFSRMIEFHKSKNAMVTLFGHPNSHPYDSSLLVIDKESEVIDWINKEDKRGWERNLVNAGIHLISSKIFTDSNTAFLFDMVSKLDLDRDVLKRIINKKKLYVYASPEYVVDMGTPDRYTKVFSDIKNGIPHQKNLQNKQKAVFLDRDGTINKYVGFLRKVEDFELLPRVAEAIAIIRAKGFLVIIITNQPVIARGEVSFSGLNEIHNKMETLLGQAGTYVDGIYFCPHHPDKGYPGEIVELKINCNCRKPKTGLVEQATKDFNVDVSESYFVGDGEIDIMTGMRAGCHTALISTEREGENIYKSLFDFAQSL